MSLSAGASVLPEEFFPSSASRQIARAHEAAFAMDLNFAPGSTELTRDAQSVVEELLDLADRTGTVRKVQAVSWWDSLPETTMNAERADAVAMRLAQARNLAIERTVRDLDHGYQFEGFIFPLTKGKSRPGQENRSVLMVIMNQE
jgi:hypothetical protein